MTAAADPSGLVDAQAIRAAVLGSADVVALSAGPFGEVASYFAGRRVPGVRIDADRVEVHVVVRYGPPLPALAQRLGHELSALLGSRRFYDSDGSALCGLLRFYRQARYR